MQRGTELIASRFNSAFFNHQNHSFFWCPGAMPDALRDGVSLLGGPRQIVSLSKSMRSLPCKIKEEFIFFIVLVPMKFTL